VIKGLERLLQCKFNIGIACNSAAESTMKIYLLILLISAILTAVHFTSAPEQRSKTMPQ
jgi:hypothetical protein